MTEATPRARPTRKAAEQAQRRRRSIDYDASTSKRIAVDHSKLDPNFTYRAFNDEPGRLTAVSTHDDWDPVTSEDLGGGENKFFVGYKPDGTPLFAYLYKKPIVYHQQDQNAKIARNVEEEQELLRRAPEADGKGYTDPRANKVSGGVTRIASAQNQGGMREADDTDA